MPKVEWTSQQQSAILEKNNNILVAAAAGSGKTAVLVERIINKIINEDVDIDKLLVVTFTNAAASEMRQRILDAIYKKIEEQPQNIKLQRQINLLNKANICTIHSFCLEIIRNYFYELDISANFRIADTAEIELLKQDVIEDLFEEKYINKDEKFLNLINTYTNYRDDNPLKELIFKIYNFIQSAPFPKMWLEENVEKFSLENKYNQDFSKTIWGKILINEYKNKIIENKMKLEGIYVKLKRFDELDKFSQTISQDIEKLKQIQFLIENKENEEGLWNKAYILSNELSFDRWPTDKKCTLDLKQEAKDIRDNVKESINNITKKIFTYNSEEASRDIYSMYDTLWNIKDLINEFEENFNNKKKEKNIIDFHDIEHFALKILLKEDENGNYITTDVANKIKEQYAEIAIDEYQDSNLVQEYILNSISNGNNIFMVGDVKQSIYKFRQARPELFLEKYENYVLLKEFVDDEKTNNEKQKEGKKIQLFKNFRSRKNILDLTNIIFEQIMSRQLGDIDYNEEEYLNLGANYEKPKQNINYAGKAEMHIIDLEEDNQEFDMWKTEDNSDTEDEQNEDNEEPIENTMLEANLVAGKIKELLKSNYMVFDKDKGYRNITYKDIVILLRTTKNTAPIYEKKLSELNIPVFSDTSSNALDSTEIQTIMNLLRIINNPLQDIPLITVLRSSIGNFTDNDLVQIRLIDRNDFFYNTMLKARLQVNEELKNKIEKFINMLEKWRESEEVFNLDELIWQIYVDSNYYNYVGLLSNGKLRQANLKMLFEKAKQYETASFKGLYNFINFIDKLKTSSKDMQAARIIGENDNVVRIMSIHKSKGLEFPVVFLCNSNKNFNMMDLNDTVLLHQDLGFGPKYINYERRIEYNTLAKEALRIKLKNEIISEEMRVLYVALTRAKEKLFITGIEKDIKKSIKEKEELINIYNESKINHNLLKKYKSYLDWIELVYLNNKEKMQDIIDIYKHSYKDINQKQEDEEQDLNIINLLNKQIKENNNEENIKKIEEKLNWNYKYELSENIPTKTSVSKIKEEKNKENELYVHNILDDKNSNSKTLKEPKFSKEEKISSAQKGTLIHMCLQKLDEKKEYNYETVEQLIKSQQAHRIITEKEAESININAILKYTQSDLFKSLRTAKEIYKEQPFYINLPAREIYNVDVNENVLVQGIIDLFFIDKDGKVILVDYKTDYVQNENELIEKYSQQLSLYKKAIEKSLNVRVDKVVIYSIYMQKEIEI